jgi:hypothetical protein
MATSCACSVDEQKNDTRPNAKLKNALIMLNYSFTFPSYIPCVLCPFGTFSTPNLKIVFHTRKQNLKFLCFSLKNFKYQEVSGTLGPNYT